MPTIQLTSNALAGRAIIGCLAGQRVFADRNDDVWNVSDHCAVELTAHGVGYDVVEVAYAVVEE